MLLLADSRFTPFVLVLCMFVPMLCMLVLVRLMFVVVGCVLVLVRFMFVVVGCMLIRFVVGQTDDIGGGLFDGAVCICG